MACVPEVAGVLPVVQTPYAEDGSIDVAALDAELAWILDQGVDGLTTGMVSEILSLSGSERRLLTERVVAAAHGRGRASVISCGAESLPIAVGYAEHAAAVGATALMANPPITAALGDEAVHGYFVAILGAVDLPVVVQDASGYVGRPLSLAVQGRLFEQFGDRVLFKPEAYPIGPRLSRLRDLTGGRAAILEGSGGAAIIDSFRRGIVGTMPGSEVCWAIRRLWDAVTCGDWETAYAITGPLNMLVGTLSSIDGYVAVEKHLLWRQGVLASTRQREPRGYALDEESIAEIDRLFDRIARAAGQPERIGS